uniref:RRM domain-containing protein n=1 Tax=Syphacia muris TaxID=451379 RepID=A0A0N5ATF6_9BILA
MSVRTRTLGLRSKNERSLHVTNIHYMVEADQIYSIFEKVGPVEKVVLKDSAEHRPTNAIVIYKYVFSVTLALAKLERVVLCGQTVLFRPFEEYVREATLIEGMSLQRRRLCAPQDFSWNGDLKRPVGFERKMQWFNNENFLFDNSCLGTKNALRSYSQKNSVNVRGQLSKTRNWLNGAVKRDESYDTFSNDFVNLENDIEFQMSIQDYGIAAIKTEKPLLNNCLQELPKNFEFSSCKLNVPCGSFN